MMTVIAYIYIASLTTCIGLAFFPERKTIEENILLLATVVIFFTGLFLALGQLSLLPSISVSWR